MVYISTDGVWPKCDAHPNSARPHGHHSVHAFTIRALVWGRCDARPNPVRPQGHRSGHAVTGQPQTVSHCVYENVMRVPPRCAREDTGQATQSHVRPSFKNVVMHVPTRCARKDTGQAMQSHLNAQTLRLVHAVSLLSSARRTLSYCRHREQTNGGKNVHNEPGGQFSRYSTMARNHIHRRFRCAICTQLLRTPQPADLFV